MGTDTFKTAQTLIQIVEDQFHNDGQVVAGLSLNDGRAQGVALRIDVNEAERRDRDFGKFLRDCYVVDATGCVTVAFVVLVDGWQREGMRTVSVKVLPEYTGPYHYPRGDYLLEKLSPVRSDAHPVVADSVIGWRETCAEKMPPVRPVSNDPVTLLV